jgi:acyl carrier protein
MIISSRTPEGDAYQCPVCGATALLESSLAGDVPCPSCGQLLWWLRNRLNPQIDFGTLLSVIGKEKQPREPWQTADELGIDSLDVVEMVMEIEDNFGVTLSDEDLADCRTVEDIIRLIQLRRKDEAA